MANWYCASLLDPLSAAIGEAQQKLGFAMTSLGVRTDQLDGAHRVARNAVAVHKSNRQSDVGVAIGFGGGVCLRGGVIAVSRRTPGQFVNFVVGGPERVLNFGARRQCHQHDNERNRSAAKPGREHGPQLSVR
jgi:hypothetical protein